MLNFSKVQECLDQVVGFHQTEHPDYPKLDSSMLVSESKLYYNDHPLISVEVLDNIVPNFNDYYDEWDSTETYSIGDKVQFNDNKKQYESLSNNNLGNIPADNPADWQELSLISEYLQKAKKNAISKVYTAILEKKKLKTLTKDIFENLALYTGVGKFSDLIIKEGRFVGFEFTLKREENIAVKFNKIGTQFSQINPNFQLYIYHSSLKTPFNVSALTLTKGLDFQWTYTNDIDISYNSSQHDAGGSFYIGYFEDDLVGQAVRKRIDLCNPCDSCGGTSSFNYKSHAKWSQYIEVKPFYVEATDLNGTDMWDVEDMKYTQDTNFGLNFDITVGCDMADFMCKHSYLFARPLQLQFQRDMLEAIAYNANIRNNAIQGIGEQKLLNEDRILGIIYDKHNGLDKQLNDAIDAIDFNFSSLNSSCLPCNNNKGITRRYA